MVKEGPRRRWLSLSFCTALVFLVGASISAPPVQAAKLAHACGSPPRQETPEEEDEHPPAAYNLTGTLQMGYFNERRERLPPSVVVSVANMTMGETEGKFENAPGTQEGSEFLFRGIEKGTTLVVEVQRYTWTATFQDLCTQANGRVGGEGESNPNPNHGPGFWVEVIPPSSSAPAPSGTPPAPPSPPAATPPIAPSSHTPTPEPGSARIRSVRHDRHGLGVTVACGPRSPCRVTVGLAARWHGLLIPLGTRAAQLRPGQVRTLMLSAGRNGRAWLSAHRRANLEITLALGGRRVSQLRVR
jgi:hypothetical protein